MRVIKTFVLRSWGFVVMNGLAITAISIVCTEVAMAAPSLGEVGNNIGNSAHGLAAAVRNLAYLAGVVLSAMGIHKLATHSQNKQEPLSSGLKLLGGGAALLAFGYVAQIVGATAFGSSTSVQNGLNSLGQ